MPNTGLGKPFLFTMSEINRLVTRTSAGVYTLGYLNNEGTFIVKYVGRSDTDLKNRLSSWIGKKVGCTHFKANYCASADEAFKRECAIYHDFGGVEVLDNDIHPDRPIGRTSQCDLCYIFG